MKVLILPTPVEPEIIEHSRTTPNPHSGEEIEGSGGEGQPGAMVTSGTMATNPVLDHSRSTPGPHSGEEIEGSGNDGHPVDIATSSTTHIGHEGQGHIIAVTTTTRGHEEGSGSGQGQTEHEGNLRFLFFFLLFRAAMQNFSPNSMPLILFNSGYQVS